GCFAFAIPFMVPVFTVLFGAEATAIATATAYTIGVAIAGTALGMGLKYLDRHINESSYDIALSDQAVEEKEKKKPKKPPYDGDKLGEDPSKCPGDGFKWKGKGSPESGKGSWHNPDTKESLHPDLDHPPPEKPHWDYTIKRHHGKAKLNIDGTWEWVE